MKKTLIAVGYLPLLVGLLATLPGSTGCKKKEEDLPPAPSATPPPPPPEPTPVVIAPEFDAGVEDAAVDVKKPVGKAAPADVAGLRACCTALQQNASSMPPPNNAYALQASNLCLSLVNGLATGSATKAGALGAIGGIMKGANLPPACK
ncbi:MAG TPA: acyltransferase [Polyangiaceae bacterium]|jgi:hypothetical protein|nr:acyltransferase [Polyangiaceae bacterium]